MKHILPIWAFAWLTCLGAAAQNVTEQQALATAQQFLQGKTFETTAPPRRAAKAADAVAERGIYIVCPDGNRQGSNTRRVIVK